VKPGRASAGWHCSNRFWRARPRPRRTPQSHFLTVTPGEMPSVRQVESVADPAWPISRRGASIWSSCRRNTCIGLAVTQEAPRRTPILRAVRIDQVEMPCRWAMAASMACFKLPLSRRHNVDSSDWGGAMMAEDSTHGPHLALALVAFDAKSARKARQFPCNAVCRRLFRAGPIDDPASTSGAEATPESAHLKVACTTHAARLAFQKKQNTSGGRDPANVQMSASEATERCSDERKHRASRPR